MHYIDGEGSIIVPKSVRPIIDYKEASLGNKKGAKREFRYRNLHIREYDGDYYIIHRDKIDPRKDSLGYLLVDAPEYLASSVSASYIGYKVGEEIHKTKKASGKNQRTGLYDTILAGFIADSAPGWISSYIVSRIIAQNRST